SDRTEHACALWHAILLDDHAGVVIEANAAAISAAGGVTGAEHNRAPRSPLLFPSPRSSLFYRDDDQLTHARVATSCATEHTDAHGLLCTCVIGNGEVGLLLDHLAEVERPAAVASSTISLTRGTRLRTSTS